MDIGACACAAAACLDAIAVRQQPRDKLVLDMPAAPVADAEGKDRQARAAGGSQQFGVVAELGCRRIYAANLVG